MEITFQNKREDLDAFYGYLLRETQEGKRIGKIGYSNKRKWTIMYIALISALFWGVTGKGGISLLIGIGLLILGEVLMLLFFGFKPQYFYGNQIYKEQEKLLTSKDLQIIQLKRTLTADDDWLEIRSSEAVHRWRWRRVDQIGITTNFVYIHVGNCPVVYVPKRDFHSEQSFIEFGKKLVELKEKHKDEPFGAE